MVNPAGDGHPLENLRTAFVFSWFGSIRALTDDGAGALLLSGSCHRFVDTDARTQQPVRREQLISFCEAHAANLAICLVSALQHLCPNKIIGQHPRREEKMSRTLFRYRFLCRSAFFSCPMGIGIVLKRSGEMRCRGEKSCRVPFLFGVQKRPRLRLRVKQGNGIVLKRCKTANTNRWPISTTRANGVGG